MAPKHFSLKTAAALHSIGLTRQPQLMGWDIMSLTWRFLKLHGHGPATGSLGSAMGRLPMPANLLASRSGPDPEAQATGAECMTMW